MTEADIGMSVMYIAHKKERATKLEEVMVAVTKKETSRVWWSDNGSIRTYHLAGNMIECTVGPGWEEQC